MSDLVEIEAHPMEPGPVVSCLGCGRSLVVGRDRIWAHVSGNPYQAYYCSDCAKGTAMNNPMYCQICGGDLALLGQLGNLTWFRCIQCGMEQARKSRKGKRRSRRKSNPIIPGATFADSVLGGVGGGIGFMAATSLLGSLGQRNNPVPGWDEYDLQDFQKHFGPWPGEKSWGIKERHPIDVFVSSNWTGHGFDIKVPPMKMTYDTHEHLGANHRTDIIRVTLGGYDYKTGEADFSARSLEDIREWEKHYKGIVKVHYPKGDKRSNPPSEPRVIAQFRKIVDERQHGKVGGVKVDLFSASAVISIYDALSEENKAMYAAMNPRKMISVAFKLMERQGNPEA